MSKTADTGVDFVHRIIEEIKVLQGQIAVLNTSSTDLGTRIDTERKTREGDVSALHERLSQERAAETLMRNALEKRQEEFEGKAKTWVGALGKDSVATKDQINNMDAAIAERNARQAASDDARIVQLEAAMPTKSTVVEVQKVAAELAGLQTQVDRDRVTAAAAVKAAAATAAHDFKMVEEHLERLQHQVEANKKALVSDLTVLQSKVDSVETFMQTRAKATDLQALEPRVFENERATDKLSYELKTKAAIATVNAVSDRLTNLTMDVQANQARAQALEPRIDKVAQSVAALAEEVQTKASVAAFNAVSDRVTSVGMDVQANLSRAQADKETLAASISSIEKALSKTDRQVEYDRERVSACVVALEKELATKAAKIETDMIGPTTLKSAVDRIEMRAQELEKQIKLAREEVPPVKARVAALEAVYPTKADASEIPRLSLAMADQSAKHEALHSRHQEHGVRIEQVHGTVQHHLAKVEAVESRAVALERSIGTKAESQDYFTKEYTTDLLRDFYRREEVDAMLSRVWWRVGDMTKGKMGASAPLPARN